MRGYLHDIVLLPLLRNLSKITETEIHVQSNADNIVLLVLGKFVEISYDSLKVITNWCIRKVFDSTPHKTSYYLSLGNRNLESSSRLILDEVQLKSVIKGNNRLSYEKGKSLWTHC